MNEPQANPPSPNDSLWLLVAAPLTWAAHLLLSYSTAAIWCAKVAGPGGSLGAVRVVIGIYTAAGLVGIALIGWRGWKWHDLEAPRHPRAFDSAEGRQRFLGFATVLLAGVSAIAVGYQGLAALFIGSCQ